MTEAEKPAERVYTIQRIYTKDISFETPNSPSIFLAEWKPDIQLNVATKANKIDEADNAYEIVLTLTVTVKSNDKVAYLIEVHQAGVFIVEGFSEQEMGPIIGIASPSNLFPYAREVVSDLVSKGSFPQMVLQPINFEQMFKQHMSDMAKQQAEGDPDASAKTLN